MNQWNFTADPITTVTANANANANPTFSAVLLHIKSADGCFYCGKNRKHIFFNNSGYANTVL